MLNHLKAKIGGYGLLEPAILSCFIAMAILLCGFAELAHEVMRGDTYQIDAALLMVLRNANKPDSPIGPIWLQDVMRDFSALGGIAVLSLITFLSFVYLLLVKKAGRAFYLLATVISGTCMSNLLKHSFDRPRPDFAASDPSVFTASFPSGHSLMSAVVYLSLGALLAQAQPNRHIRFYLMTVVVLLAVTIGISRVYLGMHWPSDVLAGWMLGALWALLFWTAERLYRGNKKSSTHKIHLT